MLGQQGLGGERGLVRYRCGLGGEARSLIQDVGRYSAGRVSGESRGLSVRLLCLVEAITDLPLLTWMRPTAPRPAGSPVPPRSATVIASAVRV